MQEKKIVIPMFSNWFPSYFLSISTASKFRSQSFHRIEQLNSSVSSKKTKKMKNYIFIKDLHLKFYKFQRKIKSIVCSIFKWIF
jgi:hypothetical protein